MKIFLLLSALCLAANIHAALDALPRGLEEVNKIGYKGDLDEIKQRGFLRVLTRNTPGCYFIHRGELIGFEYELVNHFAKDLGVKVVVIVPPAWDEMAGWLESGRADMAAANISITTNRLDIPGLEFCHPYGDVFELVVTRSYDASVRTLADLEGRTFHVRKTSPYYETLIQYKQRTGTNYEISLVPESEETVQIMEKVGLGEYDLTLADQTLLDQSISMGEKIKGVLRVKTPRSYGWVVRSDQPNLKASINRFFEAEYKGTTFNVLYRRYFHQGLSEQHAESYKEKFSNPLSPYDELAKTASKKYNMPWTLICAQMYQESRFIPDAESWAGAKGLMQLMPATAGDLGVRDILDPASNINGGVKYLRQQYDRLPTEVDAVNRTCFALASYNGGYGHLIDARKLAEQMGKDPNIWAGHVDQAYALLSDPDYASRAKYGYCRSNEIIGYVRNIMSRYVAYDTAQKQQ